MEEWKNINYSDKLGRNISSSSFRRLFKHPVSLSKKIYHHFRAFHTGVAFRGDMSGGVIFKFIELSEPFSGILMSISSLCLNGLRGLAFLLRRPKPSLCSKLGLFSLFRSPPPPSMEGSREFDRDLLPATNGEEEPPSPGNGISVSGRVKLLDLVVPRWAVQLLRLCSEQILTFDWRRLLWRSNVFLAEKGHGHIKYLK